MSTLLEPGNINPEAAGYGGRASLFPSVYSTLVESPVEMRFISHDLDTDLADFK